MKENRKDMVSGRSIELRWDDVGRYLYPTIYSNKGLDSL
jgi:hypothetical protein